MQQKYGHATCSLQGVKDSAGCLKKADIVDFPYYGLHDKCKCWLTLPGNSLYSYWQKIPGSQSWEIFRPVICKLFIHKMYNYLCHTA